MILGWPDLIMSKISKNSHLHFLSSVEKNSSLFSYKRNFILPNIINIELVDNPHNKKICFIGRLAIIKGIDDLINVNVDGVDIYGIDQDNYVEKINNSMHLNYKGELQHDQVQDTLSKYEAMILPSYGEGLPTSVIEAALSGRILIISTETNLDKYRNEYDCIIFKPGIQGIKGALKKFNSMTLEERHLMKERSTKTAYEYYSKEVIESRMQKKLDEILSK